MLGDQVLLNLRLVFGIVIMVKLNGLCLDFWRTLHSKNVMFSDYRLRGSCNGLFVPKCGDYIAVRDMSTLLGHANHNLLAICVQWLVFFFFPLPNRFVYVNNMV